MKKVTPLEEFIEISATLPNDIFKSLTLLRELDLKVNEIMSSATSTVEKGEFDSKILDQKYKEAMQLSDEKIQISIQTYETIDKMIKILDEKLSKSTIEKEPEIQTDGSTPPTKKKKTEKTPPPKIVEQDIPVDPNEPVYCYCKKVSYGQMICCDSDDCEKEWFHFACVGLTEEPKNEWFCPDCEKKKKK